MSAEDVRLAHACISLVEGSCDHDEHPWECEAMAATYEPGALATYLQPQGDRPRDPVPHEDYVCPNCHGLNGLHSGMDTCPPDPWAVD